MLVKMPNGIYIDPADVGILKSICVCHDAYSIMVVHKPFSGNQQTCVADCYKRSEVQSCLDACAETINKALQGQ